MAEVFDVLDSDDDDIQIECSQTQSQKWQEISISSSSSDDGLPTITFPLKRKPASSSSTSSFSNVLSQMSNLETRSRNSSSSPTRYSISPVASSINNNEGNVNFTQVMAKSPRKRKARSAASKEDKLAKKAYDKAVKAAEKANKDANKPTECLKNVTACIDPRLLDSLENTGELLSQLQTCGVTYQIETQPVPRCVQWRRDTTHYYVDDTSKVCVERNTVEESEAIIVIAARDFSKISTTSFYKDASGKLPNREIYLIVYGLERYLNQRKTKDTRDFRDRVRGQNSQQRGNPSDEPLFDRNTYEFKKVELLVDHGCSVWPAENSQELAQTVARFTKLIAERQFKETKNTQHFTFYAQEFCVGSVKVTKEGIGCSKLWLQQLQQFRSAGLETARAIAGVYPSPLSLIIAYRNCSTEEEASLLLQDIQIRRGAGLLSSTRRVGPELSKKIYKKLMSKNGSEVL